MPGFGDITALFERPQVLQAALWGGLGLTTLAFFVAMRKRWRDASPLYKCTVFSVWCHLLLVIYATSVQIVEERRGPGVGPGEGGGTTVRLKLSPPTDTKPARIERPDDPAKKATPNFDRTIPRMTSFSQPKATKPTIVKPTPSKSTTTKQAPASSAKATPVSSPNPATPQIRQPATTMLPASAKAAINDALVKSSKALAPTTLSASAMALPSLDLPKPAAPPTPPPPASAATETTTLTPIPAVPAPPIAAAIATPAMPTPALVEAHQLPQLYQQRTAADRERIAAMHGGSKQTEEAVRKALAWIVANQEADGRWDASRHGSGRESQTLGQNRGGAGANADTGITGLAMLALLGSGHTHLRGDHQNCVGRALDFLAAAQHVDGNMAGNAEPYAFMYCHGMATLALSEALAMSGDERLRPIVQRAIGYTLRSQNPATGGWRYRPGERGDMSQLGWQMMALKSAELAGIEFPAATRQGIERFTLSVSSGQQGGLASYRPQEQISRPMTAEALVCRQFLGTPRQSPALDEAGNFLLGELPGVGQANYYYWYYGTLGMYQLQGEHWHRWNDALTRQLLAAQTNGGDGDGSWEPSDVWGGYGGRVYSTALATLCLEVYYRYLPLYVEAAANGGEMRRK